jgi:hypothetical protein
LTGRKKPSDVPAFQIADGVRGTLIANTLAVGMETFIDTGKDAEMTLIDNVHIPDASRCASRGQTGTRRSIVIPELPWKQET